jgi:hypothetical protein
MPLHLFKIKKFKCNDNFFGAEFKVDKSVDEGSKTLENWGSFKPSKLFIGTIM